MSGDGFAPDPSVGYQAIVDAVMRDLPHLAGGTWTDFNQADPGVTILEVLCFAVSDVVYRSGLPIEDLLGPSPARDVGAVRDSQSAFFTNDEVLKNAPVTADDYRREILATFDDVLDVFITPAPSLGGVAIPGRWTCEIRTVPQTSGTESLIENVRSWLRENRNLGESFAEVVLLAYEDITLDAVVTIDDEADVDAIRKVIGRAIQAALTPPTTSSDGALRPPEPPVRRDALEKTIRRAVLDLDGVESIRFGETMKAFTSGNPSDENFRLAPMEGRIAFERSGHEIAVGLPFSLSDLAALDLKPRPLKVAGDHPDKRAARAADVGAYSTIQTDFPSIYGLGEDESMEPRNASRKAEVRQLRGYLMLMEQLIADQLSQLRSAHRLFETSVLDETWFTNALDDIPELPFLLEGFTGKEENRRQPEFEELWSAYRKGPTSPYNLALERIGKGGAPQSEYVDHVLARFGVELDSRAVGGPFDLETKLRFLSDIPELVTRRARAGVDPCGDGAAGLRRTLQTLYDMSFAVFDPVTLVPVTLSKPSGAASTTVGPDPFRSRAYVLVAGSMMTDGLRRAVNASLRAFAPLHLSVHLAEVSDADMSRFESAANTWAEAGRPPLVVTSIEDGDLVVETDGPAWGLFEACLRPAEPGTRH